MLVWCGQERFLSSPMGKGILLLSLSLIKYSWYSIMKANWNRSKALQIQVEYEEMNRD